jgi:hypothetical protein
LRGCISFHVFEVNPRKELVAPLHIAMYDTVVMQESKTTEGVQEDLLVHPLWVSLNPLPHFWLILE